MQEFWGWVDAVWVLEMKGLCRWAGVSGEDGFVTPKNEGVQRALKCLLLGVKQTLISSDWMSACSQEATVRPEGAEHQWREDPPRELSVDLVADGRGGRVTGRLEAP